MTTTEYLNLTQLAERHADQLSERFVLVKANLRGLFPAPDVQIGVLAANPVRGWRPERAQRWFDEELAAAEVAGVERLAQRHLQFITPRPWWAQRLTVLVGASDIIAAVPSVAALTIRRALARAGSEGARLGIQVGNRTGWHPSEAAAIIAAEGWRANGDVADAIDAKLTALQ